MSDKSSFKLTYATMFNPPEALHTSFEEALKKTKANFGKEYGIFIGKEERKTAEKFENRYPADTSVVLGVFQKGSARDAQDAIDAARKAFPIWSTMKWEERVALLRKAADLVNERVYEIGTALALEVGKNRMEALGEAAEAADLIRYPCDEMEASQGYTHQMLGDPLEGYNVSNTAVLRPYGVWVVISPFNFPCALTAGPAAAALVAGNTVIIKPSSDTPWSPYLLAKCMRDAGVPDGVVNFVTGPGSTVGRTLVESSEVDGISFTGSYDVGMGIYRTFAQGKYVRPIVMEMGGKNPAIVSKNADLEDAAIGIVRSAYGLQGQKCSACSRVYAEAEVYDELVSKIVDLTEKIAIGDPVERSVYMGPVVNQAAQDNYQKYIDQLTKDGKVLTGGKILQDNGLSKGYFCAPTVVSDLPLDHDLWQQELFLPILTVAKVSSIEEGIQLANDVVYGLTAGFYGSEEECEWFFENIEAGCVYANRPQGATAGAYPQYQSFGGWKASGCTGKNAFGKHYLQLYLHEQSRTMVRRIN